MIVGITGTPLTGGLGGKTLAANQIAEMGFSYIDLMSPVTEIYKAQIGKSENHNKYKAAINRICEGGRKVDPMYWFSFLNKMSPVNFEENMVWDNVFFPEEYDLIKEKGGIVICVGIPPFPSRSRLGFIPDQYASYKNDAEGLSSWLKDAISPYLT